MNYQNAGIRPGFALGGLSTAWVAGMLPFHRDDMADWPFDATEPDEPYCQVLSFVPCSGVSDRLEGVFPHHIEKLQTMAPSAQCQAYLDDVGRSAGVLARDGFVVGQSRLAVQSKLANAAGLR